MKTTRDLGQCFRYEGRLGPLSVSGTLHLPRGLCDLEIALRILMFRTHRRTGIPIASMERNSNILWKSLNPQIP